MVDQMATIFIVCNDNLDYYATMSDGVHVDYSGALYNNGGDNLTLEQYVTAKNAKLAQDRERLAEYPDILKTVSKDIFKTQLMGEAEFHKKYDAHQRAKYLTPVKEITEARYWEMLEVLPPLSWGRNNGVESFFMSEAITHCIRSQFGKYAGRYFEKTIDTSDKTTWMSQEELSALCEVASNE